MAIIQDVAPQRPTNSRAESTKLLAKRKQRKRIILGSVLLIILVVVVGAGWGLMHRRQSASDTSANLNDVNVVKTKVSRLYLLPTDEQPALATVTNEAKLSSSFSGRVKDGDKILIYQSNRKAIAYRPSIDKIVDVEPVSIDTPPSQAATGSN